MAIKRLKNATSAKTTDSNKPATIDREEMKRRLGKAKKTASAKQTSKQTSAKQTSKRASAKKVSAKVDTKVDAAETKAMDLRTMQTGMEQMLTMLMNMSKEYAAVKDRVSELEDSVTERINNVVGMVKHQAEQVDELYDYVTENLDEDCDEDEDEAEDDDDELGDEVGDDCEEDCDEDDCEEEEEDGDDCEEDDCEDEDCDEGEEEGDDEEDMDLDPANYTPEEVMDILSEFDDADLKELVSEVKERLGLVRNYSLKTLLKDETRRGVILQVINDFAYNDEEDEEDE